MEIKVFLFTCWIFIFIFNFVLIVFTLNHFVAFLKTNFVFKRVVTLVFCND